MNALPAEEVLSDALPVETPDVVIVGAGPAGLSAAAVLAGEGRRVVVLERSAEAGGIPRHCGHSPFGMREFHRVLSGRSYAERLAAAAVAAGADIRLKNSAVRLEPGLAVLAATPEGLRKFLPKRVILATGIREATRAARLVGGERPGGIINTGALQDYVYRRGLRPFRRPLVVGTELVSMSALLTCRHAGIKPVAVIEGGPAPVLRAPYSWLPKLFGIPVHCDTEIDEVFGAETVEAVSLRNKRGRAWRVACDGVLFTGGFTPEAGLARMSGLAIDLGSGGPVVDSCGRTSMAGVFAAGNILRGVETAGWCWAEGRAVAQNVLGDLDHEATSAAGIRVEAGENVKLVVPQILAPGPAEPASGTIQIRLARPVSGNLVLESEGRVLWQRHLNSGPERRIEIPLKNLRLPPDVERIVVAARLKNTASR